MGWNRSHHRYETVVYIYSFHIKLLHASKHCPGINELYTTEYRQVFLVIDYLFGIVLVICLLWNLTNQTSPGDLNRTESKLFKGVLECLKNTFAMPFKKDIVTATNDSILYGGSFTKATWHYME